jgi:hypothetical protein
MRREVAQVIGMTGQRVASSIHLFSEQQQEDLSQHDLAKAVRRGPSPSEQEEFVT